MCPTKLETPDGVKEFPLLKPYIPSKFANSEGMGYEAEEIRKCLQEGRKESAILPLKMLLFAEIMDEVMK